ncbi:Thaumatin family [Popillia japonica]|uniref:Thaumatin family n=1 Tax=Popillia japonica TaxID=7064 RepID=A0AAW1KI26_POPJA
MIVIYLKLSNNERNQIAGKLSEGVSFERVLSDIRTNLTPKLKFIKIPQSQTIENRTVDAADDWAGRFWARTWCNTKAPNFCETGDCGSKLECAGNGGAPPASLVEIALRGWGGLDYYDISLVDGFNVKASIEPVDGRGADGRYGCKKAACNHYINDECPQELRLYGSTGVVIGCKSACLAFNTDQYCCRGNYGVPEKCKSTDWPVNWPDFFKKRCPDAYSYAYDDHSSTFKCIANTYRVTFG